jgi:hypothetical protein
VENFSPEPDPDPGDVEDDDPSKLPGDGANDEIQPKFLAPFYYGWTREVVFRQARRTGRNICDVYYVPLQSSHHHARPSSRRKQRSRKEQEQYYENFPDKDLSADNFCYLRRPLGLNNKAYEVVRLAKSQEVKDGVPDQDEDPLALSPTVELYKLPGGINSWVHLDVNSNAIDPGQDMSKSDIAAEIDAQWDGSESKAEAKARIFNTIGRRIVWQSRDLSDDNPADGNFAPTY